jgi:hypothetical protein
MLSVQVDVSFTEQALRYLSSPSPTRLKRILGHPAAKGVHIHAARFGNTNRSLVGFWEERLARIEQNAAERARANVEDMNGNAEAFTDAFDELDEYLPHGLKIGCRLYAVVGYDVGVVSEGDAYLNLAHSVYADKRELVYFAMHELHHVAFTRLHPIYSFSGLSTTVDLRSAVMYSTHLEGLAVYSAYGRRRREGGLNHLDYRIYRNQGERDRVIEEYFKILDELRCEPMRSLREDDFELIERLSGERLWYVAGLHMAKTIDERLGREKLNETMRRGPVSFFEAYESSLR